MLLKDLVDKTMTLDHLNPQLANIEIAGLSSDSRAIQPGWLFAALPGSKVDGRSFIPKALDQGASVILAPRGTAIATSNVQLVEADNVRLAFSKMAAKFYAPQPAHAIAVTGTNGKTSSVTFVRQLWKLLGLQGASVGTLGVISDVMTINGGLTTPDPVLLHQRLNQLAQNGVTHLAMEASSHGLDQYRRDGVQIKVAAFTNLSRDHLDYHASMEDYFNAKARLFSEVLQDDGVAVLNADSDCFDKLNARCKARGLKVLSYGQAGVDIHLIDCTREPHGQHLKLSVLGEDFDVFLPLAGSFQVENVLCALAIVLAEGFDPKRVVPCLEQLSGVPGRIELVGQRQNGAGIYVDYAHTPDALETVIEALRPHCDNRMVVIFGAGGDRDRGKRAQMGAVAARLADIAIVSDDNPRSEDPASIRAEILSACPNALEIGDRKAAIKKGISLLEAGDVLVIAGKGHESGQTVGDQVFPFDDRDVARALLAEVEA